MNNLLNDSSFCADIDECSVGNHKCNENAKCLNFLGKWLKLNSLACFIWPFISSSRLRLRKSALYRELNDNLDFGRANKNIVLFKVVTTVLATKDILELVEILKSWMPARLWFKNQDVFKIDEMELSQPQPHLGLWFHWSTSFTIHRLQLKKNQMIQLKKLALFWAQALMQSNLMFYFWLFMWSLYEIN